MSDIETEINIDGVDDLHDTIEGLAGIMGDLQENAADFGTDFSSGFSDMNKFLKAFRKNIGDTMDESKDKTHSFIEKVFDLNDAWKEMGDKLASKGNDLGKLLSSAVPSQAVGMKSSVDMFKKSILNELPFGGIMGLMILGGQTKEEVRAMGAGIARSFQQSGSMPLQSSMNQIASSARELGKTIGVGRTGLAGEFAASAAAMAQSGVDIEEVMEKSVIETGKRAGESILTTSVRIDSLFKQGAGTAARQMGSMIKDFNMDVTDSQKAVLGLGLIARDSGTSVDAFMGTVMRSSSALRTQRVDITEVAEAQLKFQKILQSQGMGEKFSAGYAERAIGQVAAGISGMGVGLSAVLGERITSRRAAGGNGEAVTGLEAYYSMREGFGGDDQKDKGMFTETIKELLTLSQEGGKTEEEQRFFLEKMGMGFEGSKALVAIGKDMGAGVDVDKAIENHQKEIKDAFKDRGRETSDFQKNLQKIQDGIAKVGASMLSIMIDGFRMLGELARVIVGYLVGGDTGKKMVGEGSYLLQEMAKGSDNRQDMLWSNIKETFEGVEGFGKTIFNQGSMTSRSELLKPYERNPALQAANQPGAAFDLLNPGKDASPIMTAVGNIANPISTAKQIVDLVMSNLSIEVESELKEPVTVKLMSKHKGIPSEP